MSDIQIIQGDCLEVMKTFSDNQFDLVLTDPPYGIGYDKKAHKSGGKPSGRGASYKTEYIDTDWDSATPESIYFDEIIRVSKNQIIFGAEHLCLNLPKSRGWIVWDKLNGTTYFADCELAWTSYDRPVRKFEFMWNGMIQGNMACKEKRVHPTQKPRELMMWCLKQAGEVASVLDPFAGSGSTGVACKALDIDCTLIEINEKYYQDCRRRVQEEKDKMGLFPDTDCSVRIK